MKKLIQAMKFSFGFLAIMAIIFLWFGMLWFCTKQAQETGNALWLIGDLLLLFIAFSALFYDDEEDDSYF